MKIINAVCVIAGCVSIFGCSHPLAPVGHFQDSPVTADGNSNDWTMPLRFSDALHTYQYSVTNDKANIYICIITDIESTARKVSAGELAQFAEVYHVSLEWLVGRQSDANDKVKLAARKLQGLKEADLDTVMRIIDSFRKTGAGK